MGCIPSKRGVFEQFDDGPLTSKGRTPETKKKHPKASKQRRPASPSIPADAPPWVTGHKVMAVHQDKNTGEVYLTEKNR
jgi:hypothetical protein